jgi:hypothetical protein
MIFSLPNWRSEAVPPCTSCFSIALGVAAGMSGKEALAKLA